MQQSALRSEIWTYASGRVAALEGQLLTAEALERLAAADSLSAAGAALSDSPLRAMLAEADTPAGAAAAIAAYYAEAVASLEKGVEEGRKLIGIEDLLAKNILELSKTKKLDEALEGLRYTLVSVQPLLEKLRQPTPLRINLGGVELPVSGTRGF